jgi:acyl-CoA thioesterase FadM
VLLTEGDIRVACVDAKSFRPRPLPDFITVEINDGQ